MSSQQGYTPIAFATLNGTVTITATASPGTTIIQATVPPTTAAAIDVEITDVDFYVPACTGPGNPAGPNFYLQMFVSGFGLSSPVYQNIGHTPAAGEWPEASIGPPACGYTIGNIRWFLPNGAAGVNLGAGGTVGFAAYANTANAIQMGASYEVVWAVPSAAPPPPPPPPPPASGVEVGASYIVVYVHFGGQVV